MSRTIISNKNAILLTKFGRVTYWEENSTVSMLAPDDPKKRSGFGRLTTTEYRARATARIILNKNATMAELDIVSFRRAVWKVRQARVGDHSMEIDLEKLMNNAGELKCGIM